jgi:hypothetical protein
VRNKKCAEELIARTKYWACRQLLKIHSSDSSHRAKRQAYSRRRMSNKIYKKFVIVLLGKVRSKLWEIIKVIFKAHLKGIQKNLTLL